MKFLTWLLSEYKHPEALPVGQKERATMLAPIDRALLSLAAQNLTVRKKRGDKITFDIRDVKEWKTII